MLTLDGSLLPSTSPTSFIIILIQSKRLQSTEFNNFKLCTSGVPFEDTEWMLTISHLLQWVFLPANFRSPLILRSLWEMPNFCTFDLFLSHRLLKAASQPMTHNYWASTSFMLLLKGKKNLVSFEEIMHFIITWLVKQQRWSKRLCFRNIFAWVNSKIRTQSM